MKRTFALAAFVVLAAPVAVIAQCAGSHGVEQAQSCIAGTQWDTDTNACVPTFTG